MTRGTEKVLALLAALIIILLAWFLGSWLRLGSPLLWILRFGLAAIVIAALVALWLLRWRRQAGGALAGADAGETGKEINLLIRDAEARLSASAKVPASRFRDLPLVVVLGETGAAKTTTVMRSGTDPDLLSGQAQQDGVVTPTRLVNFWLTGGTIFADLSGRLLGERAARRHLIRKSSPRQAAFGRGEAMPRAALVCLDAEAMIRPGASEAMAQSAVNLRETLGEMCEAWGINIPVYVLFTRMDRIPHFLEFAGALTEAETGLVLGATLPMPAGAAPGVYAQAASSLIGEAFDDLTASIREKRLSLLAREQDPVRLPGVFQFAREFGRLRKLTVQFLVDIARPSQLTTNPILRGFYYTGVRPVLVRDMMPAPAQAAERQRMYADATRIFQVPALTGEPAPQSAVTRKVPQWVFVTQLLHGVILRDRAGAGASQRSVKVSFQRRLAFSLAALACLVLAAGWVVSYGNNRALVAETNSAAQALATAPAPSAADPAPAETLERLDGLRAVLERLSVAEQRGAPMSYRWGLYSGDRLYQAAHDIYFDRFRQMLLQPAQTSLLGLLSRPSAAEGVGQARVYDALKAYLITTANPDKSSETFLPPVLREHWLAARRMDAGSAALAERQFRFYARQLLIRNPFPSSSRPDMAAVTTARKFLAQLSTSETIYQAMLARASEKFGVIRFNQQFPGSAATVVNNYPVQGAFTKNGWAMMQEAVNNPDQFFSAERWVMGDEAFANLDRAKLQEDLRRLYHNDFLSAWREYLRSTNVVRFAGIGDAAARLSKLAGNESPLLMAICVAALNTKVDVPEVASVFQPVQAVVPQEGCQEKLGDKANEPYRNGLTELQGALQDLESNATNEGSRTRAGDAATNALVAAQKTAGEFRIDKDGQSHAEVQRILLEPVIWAKGTIEGAALAPVNRAGAEMCGKFRTLLDKYPFSPNASQQATLQDVNAVFAPGEGALWQFYDKQLAKMLPRQGGDFSPATAEGITVNRDFLNFFRKAAAVSNALYRGGSSQPQLSFSVKPSASVGVEMVTLSINGQTQRGTSGGGPWQYSWPGTGSQDVRLGVKIAGGSELDYPAYSGLWALFQFFANADQGSRELSPEWTLRTSGGAVKAGGNAVTVRLDVNMGGAPPFFRPGYFSELRCVSPAVQKAK
jgi:type VI secretion system protein ImpL